MNISYESAIKTMILELLPKYQEFYGWGDAPGHPDLEHALEVMTDKQASRMYALLKSNNKQEVEQFLKELQSYQIRRSV